MNTTRAAECIEIERACERIIYAYSVPSTKGHERGRGFLPKMAHSPAPWHPQW